MSPELLSSLITAIIALIGVITAHYRITKTNKNAAPKVKANQSYGYGKPDPKTVYGYGKKP